MEGGWEDIGAEGRGKRSEKQKVKDIKEEALEKGLRAWREWGMDGEGGCRFRGGTEKRCG